MGGEKGEGKDMETREEGTRDRDGWEVRKGEDRTRDGMGG